MSQTAALPARPDLDTMPRIGAFVLLATALLIAAVRLSGAPHWSLRQVV